jgi:hypothetical protein
VMAGSPPSGPPQIFLQPPQQHPQPYFALPYDIAYYSASSASSTPTAGMLQTIITNVTNGNQMSGSISSRSNSFYNNNNLGYMGSNGIGSSSLSSGSTDSRASALLPPQLLTPIHQNHGNNYHGNNSSTNMSTPYYTQYQ